MQQPWITSQSFFSSFAYLRLASVPGSLLKNRGQERAWRHPRESCRLPAPCSGGICQSDCRTKPRVHVTFCPLSKKLSTRQAQTTTQRQVQNGSYQVQGKSRITSYLRFTAHAQIGTTHSRRLRNTHQAELQLCMITRSCSWSNGQGLVLQLGLGLGTGNGYFHSFFFLLKVTNTSVLPSWPRLGPVRSCDVICGNMIKCDVMRLSTCTQQEP